MTELNAAADNPQIRWILQARFQPRPLLFAQECFLWIRIGQVIVFPACQRLLERWVSECAGIKQDYLQFFSEAGVFKAIGRIDPGVLASRTVRRFVPELQEQLL